MKVNVACAQIEPVRFDVEANVKKMAEFIEKAMAQNPKTDLIIFPELIISGYECGKEFQKMAERVPDGYSMKILGNMAQKHNVHIIYGFPERDQCIDDVLYNAAVFIDNKGEILGTYRKVQLFAAEKESFRPGCEYPIFNTKIGRIGIMICWDTAFPEVARAYALQGADLLVVSTNWEKPYLDDVETRNQDDWDLMTRARAFDNCCYLAAANRIGFDETLGFFGRSKIIGPTGVPIKELNEEVEGIISAEIDYTLSHKLRTAYYTFFKDRRPDTFDIIARRY
jgi:predicted amidohydrolase